MSKKNIHRGGDFRDFLKEEGILGEVESRALKQAVSLQLENLLKKQALTKTQMAVRMKTSRAAVDRLLDASNSSVTLNTLGKAARALDPRYQKMLLLFLRIYRRPFAQPQLLGVQWSVGLHQRFSLE